ncbi:PIN domain-containing protein [Salibacterium qingdaonense]|uniref:PIN domain-containing protein n=1 Tax=Salibacterium qingdaonense TaxID=266892 RepID=A0A1I4P438_9BACI|nr:PIN domain-containing protein [Salibacterium qingdaonense]SFM22509.1 PIN domain-containing protein [Salibacterium qingdaonense]
MLAYITNTLTLISIIFISMMLIVIIPFRKKTSRFLNFVLSVAFPGLGQIYNSQYIKGFIILSTLLVSMIIDNYIPSNSSTDNTGDNSDNVLGAIILFIFAAVIVDGLIFTNTTKKLLKKKRHIKELLAKTQNRAYIDAVINNIKTDFQQGFAIGLDTNVLMHEEDQVIDTLAQGKVVISRTVLNELDGLKKNNESQTRKLAHRAFDRIEKLQTSTSVTIKKVPDNKFLEEQELNPRDNDDKIIGTYLNTENKDERIKMFAIDRNVRIKCRNLHLPILDVSFNDNDITETA